MSAGADTKSYEELRGTLAALSAEFLKQAASWDRKLFAHYGATLRVCPPEDAAEYRKSLAAMQAAEFKTFNRLSEEDLKGTIEQMVLEELALAEMIEHTWRPGECRAAQQAGESLLQNMYQMLEAWLPGGAMPEGNDARHGAAHQFLLTSAIDLEAMINPDVREKVRAIGKSHKRGASAERPAPATR